MLDDHLLHRRRRLRTIIASLCLWTRETVSSSKSSRLPGSFLYPVVSNTYLGVWRWSHRWRYVGDAAWPGNQEARRAKNHECLFLGADDAEKRIILVFHTHDGLLKNSSIQARAATFSNHLRAVRCVWGHAPSPVFVRFDWTSPLPGSPFVILDRIGDRIDGILWSGGDQRISSTVFGI